MKIVIDIPEEAKKAFDNANKDDIYGCFYDYNSVVGKAIKNGTPLPKGHGRLIDADELEELFREVIGGIAKKPEMSKDLEHMVRASAMTIEMIGDAPTILEADKEVDE